MRCLTNGRGLILWSRSAGRVLAGSEGRISSRKRGRKQKIGPRSGLGITSLKYSGDVTFDEGSTIESVARLFKNAKFVDRSYTYERRTLRVIVQERLYALKSLSNVRDAGQVFLDTACCACPFRFSIFLHLPHFSSPLAVRLPWYPPSRPQSSQSHVPLNQQAERQRRIGAESIRGSDRLRSFVVEEGSRKRLHQHLTTIYRHDLESLFYMMPLVAAHHTITPTEGGPNTEPKGRVVVREGILPYRKWFDTQDHDTLGSIKKSFFSSKRKRSIELSPTFEAFRSLLKEMRRDFANGFNRKNQDSTADEELNWREKQAGKSASDATSTPVPFDDEALGGCVDYSTVIEPPL